MDYYYRSHATTHISLTRKRNRLIKIIKSFIFFFILLLLPAGYLVFHKDNAPKVDIPEIKTLPVPVAGSKSTKKNTAAASPAPVKPAVSDLSPIDKDPWELKLGRHLEQRSYKVSSGDTLIDLLLKAGLAASEAYQAVNVVKDVFDPRNLKTGHELCLAFSEKNNENDPVFQGFRLKLDADREIQLIHRKNTEFMAREFNMELEARPVRAEIEINSSLYQASMDAGLPIDVLMQMIRAYSFDIDFQRDIRPGDSIEVMYEEKTDQEEKVIKPGAVLYASLHTRGRSMPIYRYETEDGETDFFDAEGKSVRKTLMVTPIDGARLSSGYGMRRHPIQGYNKMHHGLDFAAPTGTPIMAAGSGIVEYAGRKGNYGNYIRIRHPNEYHTVYAHLSRYARGIKRGVRVEQGQVIGYVGSTGASTGPHLHYEVHHRGNHVNPATVDTPPGKTLENKELQRFMLAKSRTESLYASLKDKTKLADASEKTKEKHLEKNGDPG